ncbi:hypothetical protein [Oceanobacter mangrovi]|uniref:hypothetical protein n=1 Tax=Oceanobacter mangrovi TaxID=2862510 RepID=UPI001C8E1076|nr:hypothetical protein [Oceanobacter mangrovi]
MKLQKNLIGSGPQCSAWVLEKFSEQTAQEFRAKVNSGAITAEEAANQVQGIQNQIIEAQRLRSSDIGKATAVKTKNTGLTLSELTDKYVNSMFGKSFSNLSAQNQNRVYLEIIESSGRTRPSVNAPASKYSKLGRGLLIVTIGVAVDNIAVAEDKVTVTARESVIIAGGFAGGVTGGAVAGLASGPGVPVCVTIGVFVGGALGAPGADFTFGWFL